MEPISLGIHLLHFLECFDVIGYILQFYRPLRQVDIEKRLIQKLSNEINKKNCKELMCAFMNNTQMILDSYIKDNRVELIIAILEKWEFDCHNYNNLFGLKLYQCDPSKLMPLLNLFNFLYLVNADNIKVLIENARQEMRQWKDWSYPRRNATGMIRLVNFCLYQKLKEPLLEWMLLGKKKKYDIVYEFYFTYSDEAKRFIKHLEESLRV